MQLKPHLLGGHLARNGLPPAALITGDEPLQKIEAADAVRDFARASGFDERLVVTVGADFDWSEFMLHASGLSLFADRRIIELRLLEGKLGKDGAEALLYYLDQEGPADLLLVSAPRLDASAKKSKWFKALERIGLVVEVWPIALHELPQWITRRLAQRKVSISPEAARFIAVQTEGNLVAASQQLDMLQLLVAADRIDYEDVLRAVSDNSRYDVFKLVDSALAGAVARTARIVRGLEQEGTEPAIVNWALTRELRALCKIRHDVENQVPVEGAMQAHGVRRQRFALVGQCVKRLPLATLRGLLLGAGGIDRMIKGMAPGRPWDELERIALSLAGAEAVHEEW